MLQVALSTFVPPATSTHEGVMNVVGDARSEVVGVGDLGTLNTAMGKVLIAR